MALVAVQYEDGLDRVTAAVFEQSLARVDAKAQSAGVGDRVSTLVADLDVDWPNLAPIDLTRTSISLHHLAGTSRTLSQLRRITFGGPRACRLSSADQRVSQRG